MKEMFNRRQRFSLRKYSVGVCSVLLGTALFAVGTPTVAADETSTSTDTSKEAASVQPESTQGAQDTATKAPGETYADGAPAPKVDLSSSTLAMEAKAATEAPAVTSEKAEEAKAATPEAGVTAEEAAKPAAKPAVAEAKPAATEAKPASDESNKPRVRSRRAVTNEAVTGDHNSNPVAVTTYLKDGEKVTPEIRDANGATVSSQPVPAGYARKEGDWYTYAIWDLTEFNKRYSRNYYARAYKRFDESTDTTVELIDKNTGNVIETRTVTDPKTGAKTNYPNGKEVPFDFQKASGYAPYHTVFVPFLGDGIGHGSANAQLERGVGGIGTNVDLLNNLTPYKQPVYYYVKQEPVEVTPEVEKQLEGRVLANGEFTFKLKEVQPNKSIQAYEETVTNKADGKATFSKLTFNKVGTYTYTITETPGSDANVEYDAMTVTMTVNVTENAQGELQATVKYSAEGGFKSSADDKIFNNYVVAPVKTKFDFTKKLAGRELKDGEFKFVLKDANGQEVETVTNKADGTVTFSELTFDNSKVGTHTYTVEEVIPATKEAGMVYDTMKATITVEVAKNGHTLTTVTNVVSTGGVDANGKATDGTADKEFNNKITPPETPVFQPEKFVLNKEKFDLTGTKLMDDDNELQDEYTETNANPYADQTNNNEAENINTKTVERGDKLVYQVWLDTKNFTDKNNIQSVGISDTYDADKLTVNAADIKAYDSVTGVDVTSKFDITVANGVITATSKASMNKSLGDAENTQVIDTTKFAFGRYYKFDIPATVKADVPGGVDIENKANQIVHVYNPVSKSVETPEKPTEKRVVNIPTKVEFNFTKKLEGRELKEGEFSFVLKDKDGKVIETVKNDATGNIKFSALEFKRGEEGTYTYTVEEVKGTETGVEYDKMVATVTVTVTKEGKVLTATSQLPVDTEFNNKVIPPKPPVTPPTPPVTPPTPPVTPPTPPVTPPTPPVTPPTPPVTPPTPPVTPPAPELPSTGEEQSASAALLGAALGLVGLAGLARRKKNED
ncbi:Spy0128 family protein [Streptococcus sp. KHUD_013]|uniref:Spy0128 family protein n=1 Tax=Streptococcus sp. KHUD_013 TaxID=3413147 RepID=UPI0040403023